MNFTLLKEVFASLLRAPRHSRRLTVLDSLTRTGRKQ